MPGTDIVSRIQQIFRESDYDISADTAQLCWRNHGHKLDIQDSEPFADLPVGEDGEVNEDRVFAIVMSEYYKLREDGVATHLVRLQ